MTGSEEKRVLYYTSMPILSMSTYVVYVLGEVISKEVFLSVLSSPSRRYQVNYVNRTSLFAFVPPCDPIKQIESYTEILLVCFMPYLGGIGMPQN